MRLKPALNTLLLLSAALVTLIAACSGGGGDEAGTRGGAEKAAGTVPSGIIFITLDTTRRDHIGCYEAKAGTPNLDSFSKDAVVFTNFFSTANTTLPSHTSMFTSLYRTEHGVLDNKRRLPAFKEFLPRLFRSSGYSTAAFTSCGYLNRRSGISQGFDTFNSSRGVQADAGQTTGRAIEWLRGNKDKPFFLWVHYFDPHMRYEPPPPFDSMYNNTSGEKLSEVEIANQAEMETYKDYLSVQDPEHYRNMYKGEVSYLDSELGRLFGWLREQGLYDRSEIWITSDHGENLGEHKVYFAHNYLYDTTVAAPLLVKVPFQEYTGRRGQLASNVDIYPTLLGRHHIPYGEAVRGVDISSAIEDGASEPSRDFAVYQSATRTGIRAGGYAFIASNDDILSGGAGPGIELYDTAHDPDQLRNLGQDMPELADWFMRKAKGILAGAPVSYRTEDETDPGQLEKIKALGYVD